MKRALLLFFAILLLGGGGIAVWKVGLPWLEQRRAEEAANAPPPAPAYVALDPFIVPLIREGVVTRQLTLAIQVEVRDEKALAELEGRIPELRDAFLSELYGLYSLRYVQEHADDLDFTKQRLIKAGNSLLGREVVTGVMVNGLQVRRVSAARG